MSKIAFIGDRDSVWGFRAFGIDVYPVSDPTEAHEAFEEAGASTDDLLEMKRTGSMLSRVGPAVTSTVSPIQPLPVSGMARTGTNLKFGSFASKAFISSRKKRSLGVFTPK